MRSAFEAHGVPIVINAEQHASVFGGLGGAFVPLHIYVDDEHAEEAAALLADLRSRDASDPALADEAGDEDADADADADASDAVPVGHRVERRRRTALALLLGCFLTFGTAHMSTGAWFRGMALAGLEVLAFTYMAAGDLKLGTFLLIACVATDMIGAIWRARTMTPRQSQLPVARARR